MQNIISFFMSASDKHCPVGLPGLITTMARTVMPDATASLMVAWIESKGRERERGMEGWIERACERVGE